MKSEGKKILIGCVSLCVVAGGIYGITKAAGNSGTVSVTPVSMLNIGYMENPLSSSGMVYDAQNQTIYDDGSKVITEVFVTEGQQVHAGDRLLSYDLTSLNLAVELSRLEADRISNNITLAEHELTQLQNTTPDPEVIIEPEPVEPAEPVLPQPAAPENGKYPYVIDLTEASNAVVEQIIEYSLDDTDEWSQTKPEVPEGRVLLCRNTVKYHNGEEKTVGPVELNEETTEESLLEKTGTYDNPYVFSLQENGIVYGSVMNRAKDLGGIVYLRFDITDENDLPLTQWLIRSDAFPQCADTDAYDVTKHEIAVIEEEPETPVIDDTQLSGYTAVELARAIRDKKQEIKKLNLDLKKAQLQLNSDKEALSDGVVYAKRDGIVRKACDPSSPPQDGTAFLEVASGTGLYVSGFVSELVLDRVSVGDAVTGYSWSSGQTVTASITSIDSYPTSAGYYNGEGNPNVSYYGFEAYIEDTSGITSGDYLELAVGESMPESGLWISRMYVRKDASGYYVYKDDNGVLAKQNIKVGRSVWGEYYEILDGLSEEDAVAFPYGKNVKEGKKTTQDDMEGDYYG